VLGTLGRREAEAGENPELDEREKPVVRRQATSIVVRSAAIALVLALLAMLLP